MKSADITSGQCILRVENENDVQFFRTWEMPGLGSMAGRYDALTGIRSNLDLRTN